MKKLLLPFDGSESALHAVHHAVAAAATGPEAEIHLLHVIEPLLPLGLPDASGASTPARFDEDFPPHASAVLAPAVAVLVRAGVRYSLHCLSRKPAQRIAAYARLAGCDAIIMGTHGRSAGANFLIGSVATQVVKLADIPVTLVK
jgi:nucleotide-binding universal stress UspA family protein